MTYRDPAQEGELAALKKQNEELKNKLKRFEWDDYVKQIFPYSCICRWCNNVLEFDTSDSCHIVSYVTFWPRFFRRPCYLLVKCQNAGKHYSNGNNVPNYYKMRLPRYKEE